MVPSCFRWNRCEAEKSARDILEGCQKVAGGRAKRYPRFKRGKKSHPGGLPEPVSCAENLASRRDAGVAAHAPGVSSRTALLNPRLPSGIPLGWPGPARPHLLRSRSGCSRQARTRPFLWRDAARRCTFLRVPARCYSWPQWPWHSISKPRATKRGSGRGVCSRDRLPEVPASLIHVMHNQRASVRIPASSAKNLTGGNNINGASNGKETVKKR